MKVNPGDKLPLPGGGFVIINPWKQGGQETAPVKNSPGRCAQGQRVVVERKQTSVKGYAPHPLRVIYWVHDPEIIATEGGLVFPWETRWLAIISLEGEIIPGAGEMTSDEVEYLNRVIDEARLAIRIANGELPDWANQEPIQALVQRDPTLLEGIWTTPERDRPRKLTYLLKRATGS